MSVIRLTLGGIGFLLALILGVVLSTALVKRGSNVVEAQTNTTAQVANWRRPPKSNFDLEVLVDGRPVEEYYARGRSYIEALKGAEYELRVRNPTGERVAVALSVDGLNTIDARHSSAWNSSKWVIEPYGSITIGGWQMSSQRARRFYFTDEGDSYGAKLGQTANLGVISAVVFRDRRPVYINPPRPITREEDSSRPSKEKAPAGAADSRSGESARSSVAAPRTNDDYAATGIGRSVQNDVTWVDMELDSQPAAEISIRYEYYNALLKLGIVPRHDYEPYPIRRREDARGFSPEP
ncbi:MAG TPA: hypothetical protein VI306_22925 [Pyrinomonadaceae bacterium]